MAERLTFHCGYRNRLGKAYNSKHNQRENFEKPKKGDTQPRENIYWDMCKSLGGKTFSDGEKLFYKKYFSPHIKVQNDKAKATRHYERIQSVAQYKEKHPPQETLLYIGRKNVDVPTFLAIYEDFRAWQRETLWDKEKRCGYLVLNSAMHLDEDTAHIQERGVYVYMDKNGNFQVSQNKALEGLGIERPDPEKPIGTKNNAKMTFTAMCREKLFEIAKSHGVELETIPLPKDEVGLPLREFQQREDARKAVAAEQQAAQEVIAGLQSDIAELEEDKEDVADELERLRRSTVREKAARDEKREAAEKQANEIVEQAKKDAEQLKEQAWELGAKEGAASAMARLNRLRQAATEEEQAEQDGPRL